MGSNAFNEIFDVIVDIIAAYALIAVMMHYGLIIIRAILVDILKIKIPEYIEVMASILLPAVVTIDFAQDTMFSPCYAYICDFLRTMVLLAFLVVVLKWLYDLITEYRSHNKQYKKACVSPPIKPVASVSTPTLNDSVIEQKTIVGKKTVEEAISKNSQCDEQNCEYSNYGSLIPWFKSHDGQNVFSAGDALISRKLYDAGIFYEYNRKLQLEELVSLNPSFTIKINDEGKRIFWEHFPSLKHEDNSNRWRFKNRIYAAHNIILGKNLILTTDDDFGEIDVCIAMIQKLLDPKVCSEVKKDMHAKGNSDASEIKPIKEDIICDGRSFVTHLVTDLRTFNHRIVIFSPFMTETRLQYVLPLFDDAIRQGKQIVVVTKDISYRKKDDRDKCRKLEPILKSHGVRIVYSGDMHEKLIFVDHDAVWVGSLNALSFTGTTGEVMHRHTDRKTVAEYAKMYQIDAIK